MKFKLLILPISLLIAFLIFLYFIQPEWASYSESKNTLVSRKNDLEDIRNNQNKFLQALESYNSISSDNKLLIKRTIPETILEEDFLYNLNLALNETGAILMEARFDQKEPRRSNAESDEKLDLKKTDVSLNIVGNYFQLRKILFSIENLDRLVRVDEMAIRENQNDLSLDLKLTIFNRDNFSNLEVNLKDRYLRSILKNGLDLELINSYKEYRGAPSSFNFNEGSVSGKEDLFDSSNPSQSQTEVIDIATDNEEEDQEDQEVDVVENQEDSEEDISENIE